MRAKVTRLAEHHFKFNVRGMEGDVDVVVPSPESTAKPQGPSPKELALAALCGCTGTDVVDLLKKFSVEYRDLTIEARANLTEKHPKVFSDIKLIYNVKGVQDDSASVLEAVKRSTHQYSGMAFMLSRTCPIDYVVQIDSKPIGEGKVEFAKS